MDKVYERCCGIDVHKKVVVACLRTGRKKEVREYGTTTRELLNLTDWLLESECQMIAMESTITNSIKNEKSMLASVNCNPLDGLRRISPQRNFYLFDSR